MRQRVLNSRIAIAALLITVVPAAWGPPRGFAQSVSAPAAAAPSAAPSDTLPVVRMDAAQARLAASRGEIVFVDIRASGQRALGHIDGDLHVPLETLPARKAELPGDRLLVFYCSCPAEELALDAAHYLIRSGNKRVAVLVGGYDGWVAAGGPVKVDASWEAVFRVQDSPIGWGKIPVDPQRCRYERDETSAAKGGSSATITCVPDPAARGFAGYVQRIDAAKLRNRRLTLSAIVRSVGIERAAFLWIAAEDSLGRSISLTAPEEASVTGSTDWRPIEVTGVVPPVAVRVVVGISLTTSGRVWVDDVRLVAAAEPGLPQRPITLENRGFEE
ncbi:MAG TPA: rhodanese-like domain-containing protein [Candidatus Eisenbacteria bacterium]|nr:rhodanese-like domain-containing protein [Candidatus Eisenbacteria bacterium]